MYFPTALYTEENILSNSEKVLAWIVLLNAMYDIACAFSIFIRLRLRKMHIPSVFHELSQLHSKMYLSSVSAAHTSVFARLMAYWILTNGCIRLWAVVNKQYRLAAIAYFLEGGCFFYEYALHRTLYEWKTWFVVFSSFFIGAWCVLVPLPHTNP